MKKHFISALATMFFAASVQAAVVVETYDEGKSAIGEDGIIVIAYPSGWNPKNEALGKAILNSPELNKAAGNAVIMGIGIPNTSTPEMQEGRKKKLGPIKLEKGVGDKAGSYPAIYLCDPTGNYYSIINAQEFRKSSLPKDEMTKEAIAKASKEVTKRMAAAKKQRTLMERAEKATGKDRIDLIAQACAIQDIARPGNALDLAKKADPEDKFGLITVLNHNFYGYIEGSAKDPEWEKRLADIETKIKNPYYPTYVKQTLYTSAVGILRRHAGAAGREKMMSYLKAMRDLDPKSIYGRSYVGAMRLWDVWSTEWKPDLIPATNGPWEISAPSMKDAGVYTVSFNFSRGKHAFTASSVELYDGDTKVAEDVHNCFAGNRHTNHVYTLEAKKKLAKPRLIINTTMGNSRDSYGNITIMKQ